jgi:transposase
MAGRKTKLTPERQATIVRLIRAGNYLETAACAAGIDRVTLREWLKRGANESEGIYAEFTDAVNEAAAMAEARSVAIIAKAAEVQWQAAAWMLERKHRHKWGRQATVADEITESPPEPERPFWEEPN